MKKLLILTDGFPYGDSERAFFETEFGALHRDFTISILAQIHPGSRIIHPVPSDVTVYTYSNSKTSNVLGTILQFGKRKVTEEYSAYRKNSGSGNLRVRCCIAEYSAIAERIRARIHQIVITEHIDVIYAYWGNWFALAAAREAALQPSLKLIVRFHGYELYHDRSPVGYQPFRRLIAANSRELIFACEAGKRYFTEQWGESYEPKCSVHYLGTGAYPPIKEDNGGVLTLISCSNVNALKRVGLIARAISLLPEGIPVCWVHAGDGPLLPGLKKLSEELFSKRNNVKWQLCGAVPHDQIGSLYRECHADLFLTASATEGGAPVSIQEAFAMGIPAVGTAVGGIPELIHDGRTGFLCSSDPSPEELSEAIMKYVHLTAAEKEDMHRNCLEFWKEHCDAEVNAEEMVRLIAEL